MKLRLTKRQQQAMETKKFIFDTAVALFDEQGYDNVTVEEITKRAGVAKGSFYTYFRSKSDIVIEEFRNIDYYYERYERNLKRYTSATKRLLTFTRAQLRYVRDDVGIRLLKLLYVNNIRLYDSESVLIDTNRYLHGLMARIIAYGQETGEFRNDLSADDLALYVNRSMRSVFLDWAISDNSFDLVTEGVRFSENMVCPALSITTQLCQATTRT
ncbi:MAG TPA: TetR/AcrR family transcriptional regulator [Alkalispirochaeta sp.]|nr:TetR/AcrR family transcriptional regulator [Alkalispirochaeta sp.]